MKAILLQDFGPVSNFKLDKEFPMPIVGERDILVRIKATAFNPIDYQMRQGKTEKKRMHSNILGREFSGVVVKAGRSVKLFQEGDQVFAASGSMGSNGTYAEYISVPEDIVAIMPEQFTFEEAAAIPQGYLTAFQILSRLPVKKKDTVFVAGAAGSVGLALVKFFLSEGHQRLIVTAGNANSKIQLIRAGLADHQIIDYHGDNFLARLISLNNDVFFDYAVDIVGGPLSEICAQAIVVNGIYADVTALTTALSREFLFNKGATIINISNFAYSQSGKNKYYGHMLGKIAQSLTNGTISAPAIKILGDLSVQSVATGHTLLENNKTQGKKLIMRVADEGEFS